MQHIGREESGAAVLPVRPEDISVFTAYLSLLAGQGEQEKCRRLLGPLLDVVRALAPGERQAIPFLAAVFRLAAENSIRTGEVSAAADLYREGIELFPRAGELRLGYGECLIRLCRFAAAESVLHELAEGSADPSAELECPGLTTYRKDTALGELRQSQGCQEAAQDFFASALADNPAWIPAHIGMIETEILKGNVGGAEQYLAAVLERLGPDPALLLAAAESALIAADFAKAEDWAVRLQGELLGDDRFEYLLFKIDFFRGDRGALTRAPYLLRGETVETEAARVWLHRLNGGAHAADPRRIPEELWRDEYATLDAAWSGTASSGRPIDTRER